MNISFVAIKNLILDIVFPRFCVGCQKEGEFICRQCFEKIGALGNDLCPLCQGSPIERKRTKLGLLCRECKLNSSFQRILSVGSYNDPILRELIHSFKYNSVKELSIPLGILIKRLIKIKAKNIFNRLNKDKTIIVPIPLHKRRLRERGFNQSEIIAEKLSEYAGFPVAKNIIIRKRASLPQADIKDKNKEIQVQKRKRNIKNAFKVAEPEAVEGKNVILVDDVATTCATLEECALALKQNGAEKIWGFVVAKG